jgi:hypothetical protein
MSDNQAATIDGERPLFVSVAPEDGWTGEQIDNLTETIGEATPQGVQVLTVCGDVEYMDQAQVNEMVNDLVDALQ